jgi:hypothetical protein
MSLREAIFQFLLIILPVIILSLINKSPRKDAN